MFSNRASCYVRIEEREKALEDCDSALELHPTYVKCLQRRAEQRRAADRLQDALEDFQKLVDLDPNNGSARAACLVSQWQWREMHFIHNALIRISDWYVYMDAILNFQNARQPFNPC